MRLSWNCRAAMVTTGVLAVSIVLPLTMADATTSAIVNGDFETDAVGSTAPTGWTITNQLVDLGVTQLGGCTTVDTSSYDTLRDYADEADHYPNANLALGPNGELYAHGTTNQVYADAQGGRTTSSAPNAVAVFYGTVVDHRGSTITDFYVFGGPGAYRWDAYDRYTGNEDFEDGFATSVLPDFSYQLDPTVRQDDVEPATDSVYWAYEPEFNTGTVDASTAYDPTMAPTSKALELRSDMVGRSVEATGYVAHGGAAVSDSFTSPGNRTISLDWAASGDADDYHVLGYVLDVNTCQQTEVLDSTGAQSAWRTTSVTLPAAGTYRFVFVSGTYDATWGKAAGAIMYVDNIRSQPTVTGTGLDLEPLFGVGDPVAGAPVQLTGVGLAPHSAWTAELHSAPVTLATGTTDASGNFWLIANLPLAIDPGRHQIILTGTAPDGSVRTDTAWITVTAAGTVGYLSLVGAENTSSPTPTPTPNGTVITATSAQVLANTGAEPAGALALAVGLLVLGGGAVLVGRTRRSAE